MCGIAGIYRLGGAAADPGSDAMVHAMVDRIGHRGPLDRGYLRHGPASIGMCRLSIIDIEGGHQPVFNEDGSVAVVLNGQIYNFVELMDALRRKGHVFRTNSDTEVLVHLYEEYGAAMLSHLNGMFALAVLDLGKSSMLLARDRLGVKPLYYSLSGGKLAFASELKALLCDPAQPATPDRAAIGEFLTLGYIRAPRSPFREILKLRPGHFLTLDRDGVREHRWWRLEPGSERYSYAESCERLRALLDDAVALRLRSNVPVGTLLSGELNSSAVSVMHARRDSLHPVMAFTVRYEDALFDELPYAKAVAQAVNADHRIETVGAGEALDLLPLLAWHLDEPSGDTAIISTYQISRLAASELRVVLSGVGGDELFGGYSRYFEGTALEHAYRHLPQALRHWLLTPLLGAVNDTVGWRARLDDRDQPERLLWQSSVFDPSFAGRLIGDPALAVSFAEEYERVRWADPVNRLMLVDLQSYLADDILHMTDRMSMAVSLEVREPLLDHRLVEFAAGLPSSFKVDQRRREWKKCFKDAMAPLLPRQVIDRPKWGFGGPVETWMKRGLETLTRRLLANSSAVRAGLLDPAVLRGYLERRAPYDSVRRGGRLWNLLSLELWARTFIDGKGNRPDNGLGQLAC